MRSQPVLRAVAGVDPWGWLWHVPQETRRQASRWAVRALIAVIALSTFYACSAGEGVPDQGSSGGAPPRSSAPSGEGRDGGQLGRAEDQVPARRGAVRAAPEVDAGESVQGAEDDPSEPSATTNAGGSPSGGLYPEVNPGDGPFMIGQGIEPPVWVEGRQSLDGLHELLASGEYAWGTCIFQLTISASGQVKAVDFLKPEDPAPEIRLIITEGAEQWRFRPATRDGEPVPVYYVVSINHCPQSPRAGQTE